MQSVCEGQSRLLAERRVSEKGKETGRVKKDRK